MNISQVVVRVLTLSLGLMSFNSYAENAVIGKVNAKSTVVLNPGPTQLRVSNDSFPYIQGHVVSTIGTDSAQIKLNSGLVTVRLAPESIASVDTTNPLKLTLDHGAIDFVAPADIDVLIDSPKGIFTLSSGTGINAVAVFRDGELAVMPRRGSLSVTFGEGDSFSVINEGNAFVSSQLNDAQVVNVIDGSSGGASIILALLAAAAIIAGIVIAAGNNDDTPTSP